MLLIASVLKEILFCFFVNLACALLTTIQVRYASLTEAVRLLGCFGNEVDIQPAVVCLKSSDDTTFCELFHNIYNVLDG